MGSIYVSEGLCRKGSDYDRSGRTHWYGWDSWRYCRNAKTKVFIRYTVSARPYVYPEKKEN